LRDAFVAEMGLSANFKKVLIKRLKRQIFGGFKAENDYIKTTS
jgi:hypothetical protein